MSITLILGSLILAILILFLLIIRFKLHAFISLIIVSVFLGVMFGLPLKELFESVKAGMGGTLGSLAVIVGLGSIYGQLLEQSGGSMVLATRLLDKLGIKNAPYALMFTGFLIAIPVFLDVGFVMLLPLIKQLSKKVNRSTLYFAIPTLAGLAVAHAFIPPTPGPVLVADALNVDLGIVIGWGIVIGLPSAILAGPIFGNYVSRKIIVTSNMIPSIDIDYKNPSKNPPSFSTVFLTLILPIILIFVASFVTVPIEAYFLTHYPKYDLLMIIPNTIAFLGEPIIALIIACIAAIYLLGYKQGFTLEEVHKITDRALLPTGTILLVTGAGGVLKQILVNSGGGEILAQYITSFSFSYLVLAWLIAVIIRLIQGSATVSMVTAAGFMAAIIENIDLGDHYTALLVLSIASGSTIFSHVNDSGFWMVKSFLGLTEAQTFKTWTAMETIISLFSIILILIISIFLV